MKYLVLFMCGLSFCFANHAQSDKKARSLFDGKTLKGWKKVAGTADYKVENGAIVGITKLNTPNTFLVYEKKFTGDFVLELEAKLEDTLLNSGIQFKSNLDPDGNNGKGKFYGYQYELDPTIRRWSGGIYDEQRRGWLYPVDLRQEAKQYFKPGVYHKIMIECSGSSVKTWLDGKPISYLEDTITTNQGLIALQVHSIEKENETGRKIHWKNIRLYEGRRKPPDFPPGIFVVNLQPNNLNSYEKENGWQLLFDGVSTQGWRGAYKSTFPEKGWEVKNGIITVLPSSGAEATNGGDIVTVNKYSAFDFSFQFRITKGANSGVKYFVTLSENNSGSAIGLEYQVLDDKVHPDAAMGRDGNRKLSSLYDLIPAKIEERFVNPPGTWNIGRIVVYPNNKVEHYLNGINVLAYVRGSKEFRDLVAISKYNIWKNFGEASEGHILLQDHGNEVSFKSIKIRKLNENK